MRGGRRMKERREKNKGGKGEECKRGGGRMKEMREKNAEREGEE